jgi:large-conductance mechanosensitive channel
VKFCGIYDIALNIQFAKYNMTPKNDKINQAKDTGLAMVLILLIVQYIKHPGWLIMATIAVLVLVMTWPAVFNPLARVWFGFSHFLGSIVSKILLTVVFFLIVTPVGVVRKVLGADPMRCRAWRKGDDSVLVERKHQYLQEDLKKPY